MKRENSSRQPASFESVVDQVFQNSLNRFFNDDSWGFGGLTSHGNQLPINIRETDTNYELEMIAPGVKKEDFQLSISGDMLTIAFQQKEENRKEGRNGWLRQEYRLQSFTRSFNLDDSVDAGKIAARYEDGILHLTLPKKEGSRKLTRTIHVE
jgi:HSP20 family protein